MKPIYLKNDLKNDHPTVSGQQGYLAALASPNLLTPDRTAVGKLKR